MDIFEPEKRSELMSLIRGKNTKPELVAYQHLRNNSVYFKKHYRSKEGIVLDLALPRKKKAVFIDGDFWHGRSIDKVVARRGIDDFWSKKLMRNIQRDKEQRELLKRNGWKLLEIWASDLMHKKTQEKALNKIHKFLTEL